MSADMPADIYIDNSKHAIYNISRYFFDVFKLPEYTKPHVGLEVTFFQTWYNKKKYNTHFQLDLNGVNSKVCLLS